METKICSKCKIEKGIICFHRFIRSKDGHKTICKECITIINKTTDVKEKRNKNRRNWGLKHRDNINESKRKIYNENKELILERNKKWRDFNKEKVKESNIKYQKDNKEKLKKKSKNYREKNKEKVLEGTRKWVKENYDHYLEKKREYNTSETGLKNKREWYHRTKTKYSHIIAWRTLLSNALKRIGLKKEGHTIDILGYSALELKKHIENQFKEGMSWNNWGEWHIDHIKPVSSFDKIEKVSVINSLTNLQVLWSSENLKKGKKYNNN